jgi:CMP-N-acetylneuraminic acid synthetase
VPRKNIKDLCGRPLIGYTIESARAAKSLTRTIVSTDDPEIASIAKELGGDVPFLRAAELAGDASPTFPVVMNVVELLEAAGEFYDAVCLLQPTNPLRRPEDVDACVALIRETNADSVVSVLPVPDQYNPNWVYLMTNGGKMKLATGGEQPIPRRQDLPPAFHRDGSVYVTRRSVLSDHGNLYGSDIRGYEMDPAHSVNIDTPEDWADAESRMQKYFAPSSSVTFATGRSTK